jgi:hypothetical protein
MQSVEHSPEAQTLGIEAKGIPGLMKAIKPSTEHSQSEKHWPSGQIGMDSACNACAFESSVEGMAKSAGVNPGPQSQSCQHWPSAHGFPVSLGALLVFLGSLGFGCVGKVGGVAVPLLHVRPSGHTVLLLTESL